MTILIISYSQDVHVPAVVQSIQSNNRRVFLLNLDEFPANYSFAHQFSDQTSSGHITNKLSGEKLNFSELSAVWLRKPAALKFAAELSPQEKAFATQETEHFLFGVLYSLNCFWLSHPLALRGAQWKGEQQIRARKFGFSIPASLMTNEPGLVKQFKAEVESDIVFKAMSSPELAVDQVDHEQILSYGIGTTIIDDEMMENLDAVSIAPCHFQRFIEKKSEIRVTVVGDKVFAAEISGASGDVFVDSRDFTKQLHFKATLLPEHVQFQCIELTKSYGLTYSAIDLLVAPDGSLQFLELNPNGQFLFIEQLLPSLPISRAVADLLCRGL